MRGRWRALSKIHGNGNFGLTEHQRPVFESSRSSGTYPRGTRVKTIVALIAYLFTLLPVLIPVWIRSGRVLGVIYLDNYKIQFRDVLFLMVITAAIGLLDLLQNNFDDAQHHLFPIDEIILFVFFILNLTYGLVGVGICAKHTEEQLGQLDRGIVGFTLGGAGAAILAAVLLKHLVG
jgi:hypothetical protein